MNHSLGKLHFVSLLHFELPVEKKNKDVRNQSVRVSGFPNAGVRWGWDET